MIPVAPGHYPTLTQFNTPWDFYIQDNFLPQDVLDLLLKLKDIDEHYTFVDKSCRHDIRNISWPIKKSILLHHDISVSKQIEDVVRNKLVTLLPPNLYVKADLVCCEPRYVYNIHKDHPDKYISIVVFLYPRKGNGTILLDDNKQLYNVDWKANRALIFENQKHGEHYYVNRTDHNRYTLNIYITKDNFNGFIVDQ